MLRHRDERLPLTENDDATHPFCFGQRPNKKPPALRVVVYSSVIYLRHNAGQRDPGHYIQELPGHRVVVEYKVIRLSEIEGQDIIDGEHTGLLPFTPLMKRPADTDSEAWLRQCIQATNAVPLDDSIKIDFLGGLAILSGLDYAPSTISRILSQEGLVDAIMRESSFAQYIKQQGIEQGVRERAIENLLDVLEIRFDLDESDLLSVRIATINDVQCLKQLHRAAVQVSNLEAFLQILDKAN